ncbi:sensor histidine kinase [Streptomonospora salina]|uniref:histidine kinase n=1 Tax=Streptomonospora salina TaxID=104205 RepID=A0A841EAU1_9ACTN|nr:histidine kinase [Streptomonospora salina]MBB6001157.1 signal transduction histidine kinase [Streptomonospora salina]
MAQDGVTLPGGASAQRQQPRWARWWARRHRIADWLLAVAFLPWTALMLVGDPHGLLGLPAMAVSAVAALIGDAAGVFLGLHAGWGALTLGAAVSTVVLFRRTRPRLMFGAATVTLLCYGDIGMAALAMFTYAAWYDDRRRLGLWSAWLTLCTLAVYTVGGPMTAPAASTMLIMFYGLPLAVGLWIGTRRVLIANLRERAERLEREQHLLADQAISAERTRIAREMHDVVAHRVSLMVLHAGGLEVSAPDGRTAESAALIRNTGRDALAELREILGVLRDNPESSAPTAPQPVLSDLFRLVGEWRSAGMPVRESATGTPVTLSAQTERTAYRIVQEALTNAAKHAPDADVRVHLDHRPDTLEITVENSPSPAAAAAPPPSSGYGLAGLRERVNLAGGSLRTGPRLDGGWRVTAVLPLTPDGLGEGRGAGQ